MIVLSHFQIKPLLASRERGKDRSVISADLGITKVEVKLDEEGATFPGGEQLGWADAEEISEEKRKCFLLEGETLREVRFYSELTGWVRSLYPTETAPTMLVSGFPMHRIKKTDPMADTRAKIEALGNVRGPVLDTSTGLGYTAIEASRGGRDVVTVEIDPTSIELARLNPWSKRLFENPRITLIEGDVFEEIGTFRSGQFGGIVHDPPTIQFAGELYSLEFYQELKRVLRHGGRLFHYIGDPNSAHGAKITAGVVKRLTESGFKKLERHPEAFGVTVVS